MQAEILLNFANIIPQTLYFIEKNLCLHKDNNFIKYAVCPKCKTLCKFDDCIQRRPNGEAVSKKCRHVNYPHHPHKTRRKPCGTILMKAKRSKSGRTFLYPKQVYCFKKVTSLLVINKPNFIDYCEKRRNPFNEFPDNILGDCFEGRIWREFQYVDGEPFLAVPKNFGLMLNVDRFQPTLHGSDSIGGIYITLPHWGRRDSAVVIALASHLCGPHEWVKLVVSSLICSERFFSGFSSFPLSSKINISKFQFDRMQDLPENHFRVSGASWVNIINYYYY